MLDERRLKTFVTAAQLGSFSRAAEVLYVTQSTVTTRIRELERELECTLFEREGRGVRLSEHGRIFVRYAQRCLQSFNDARAALANAGKQGAIRLMACHLPAIYDLPEILQRFSEQAGAPPVQLQVQASKRIFQAMLQGEVDVALVNVSFKHPDVETELVAERPLDIVAAPGLHVDRLWQATPPPIYFFQEALEDLLLAQSVCHQLGWPVEALSGIGDLTALRRLLLRGLGFGIVPREAVAGALADGGLVSLAGTAQPSLPQQITCLMLRRQPQQTQLGPAIRTLAATIRDVYVSRSDRVG